MERLALLLYLVLSSILLYGVDSQIDYGEINISDTPRLTLRHEGDSGTLVFDGPASGNPNPTTIRIQAKPNCYISLSPESTFNFDRCSYGFQMSSCISGCFHMYRFDAYYYNNTMAYIWDSSWTYFNTSSQVLYVGVCHMSQTSSNIRLHFKSVERKFEFHGDSVHSRTGQVASPYFPTYYEQNGEQTTYVFHSRFPTDKVVIEFDDFDIAPGGYLYFHPTRDYPSPLKVTDDTNRLVVTSTANQLQFIFDHGWPGESYRKHFGFKLTYKFISGNEHYYPPLTYCGRYYMTLRGGHIEFKPNRYEKLYDCVWVVKTQPGYIGTYMMLERFSVDFPHGVSTGNVSVEIHKGLTSCGSMVGKLIPSSALSGRDYDDPEGFYIRLRGIFKFSITFKMAFTSYTNYYASGCDTRDHFKCSTGHCIPKHLACDHVKHCKDGSDETFGCSPNVESRSDEETLTVSVVIPVVVSVFLLIVLCIMFVLIRRCRQAREFNNMMESSDPVVCTTDRRRRRRRHDFFQRPPDAPPTYDEALITGIPVPDDGHGGPPKPPAYTEAVATPLIPGNDFPSPPYTSRENINESFLEEPVDTAMARRNLFDRPSEIPSTGIRDPHQSSNRTNDRENNREKLHALSSGRLPNLPSIAAAVGTQSMCNISNVGENNKLMKTRSEQILAPKGLGIVNPAFTDDQGRQSRLFKGQALSSLDLPTSRYQDGDLNKGRSERGHTRSNLDLPTSSCSVVNNNLSPVRGKYPHNKDKKNEPQKIIGPPRPNNYCHSKDVKSDNYERCGSRKPNDNSEVARNYTTSDGNPASLPNNTDRSNKKQSPYQQSALERLKPKQQANPESKDNMSARDRLKPTDPKLSAKYDHELRKREKKENGKSSINGLREIPYEHFSNSKDNSCPPKENKLMKNNKADPTLVQQTANLSHLRSGSDSIKKSSDEMLPKRRLGGSNPNLCAGHRSDVHRSTMSLNESTMSFNYRGMESVDNDNSHVSLADIGEDIYV